MGKTRKLACQFSVQIIRHLHRQRPNKDVRRLHVVILTRTSHNRRRPMTDGWLQDRRRKDEC